MKKNKNDLLVWLEKLDRYQKKYDDLRKQSSDRWWHDEHFDIQLRVLEVFIAETKEKIIKLKRKKNEKN